MGVRAVVFAYHDVGVRCLSVLLAHGVEVELVVTHSDDPGESIWFGSVEKREKPRATTSGLILPSWVGPRELKLIIPPVELTAPTATVFLPLAARFTVPYGPSPLCRKASNPPVQRIAVHVAVAVPVSEKQNFAVPSA